MKQENSGSLRGTGRSGRLACFRFVIRDEWGQEEREEYIFPRRVIAEETQDRAKGEDSFSLSLSSDRKERRWTWFFNEKTYAWFFRYFAVRSIS